MPDFELFYGMLEAYPYCFGLSRLENLEATGVNRVRRIAGFDYFGQGVILGFVDTGIDYNHPAFVAADGVSRVRTIWDQTNGPGDGTGGETAGLPPDRSSGLRMSCRVMRSFSR